MGVLQGLIVETKKIKGNLDEKISDMAAIAPCREIRQVVMYLLHG
jgi:hypothetical protein